MRIERLGAGERRARALRRALLQLKEEGATVVVVTHLRGGLLPLADDIVVMQDGQIRLQGPPAAVLPALLPPPTPFKLFVLMAGAGGVSPLRFAFAILVGRGLRYFGQAWLAVLYGERALDMVKEHSGEVGIAVAVTLVLGALAVYLLKGRRRNASGAAA